jgi:UDP-N-acetylglucosamine/UDP-N-acetylgalactosamine diphosphorylase
MFDKFPWHCSHKKIPYLNESGELVQPSAPNGYKFETFVFDALRYTGHGPIVLEIPRVGEYTPIKQLTGPNSVEEARALMSGMWREWLEAAGCPAARDGAVDIEISPRFALTRDEFLAKSKGIHWPSKGPIVIDDGGRPV